MPLLGKRLSFLVFRFEMSILMLLFTACSAPVNTLKPGEPCPVTPSEQAVFLEMKDWTVAGKSPIWLNVPGDSQIPWQLLGPASSLPYEGRALKQIWAIADEIQGKIKIMGRQLDGDGIVLFPNDDSVEWVNDTTFRYKVKPPDYLIIDTSSQYKIISPKPEGYTLFGSLVIYSHPGCYQLTASIDRITVDIVIEILDK